jgi:hypothetical protein
MAKQAGDIKLIGCIQNLQFYKMGDTHYVRKKSSLTGRRVKKDKAFTLTMAYSDLLKIASPIASVVYNQLPKETREHSYFRTLTGIAIRLIKEGKTVEEIYLQLYKETFPSQEKPADATVKEHAIDTSFADKVLKQIFSTAKKESETELFFDLNCSPP